jgi:ABC-type Na+ transport system ATPase subunit NatA
MLRAVHTVLHTSSGKASECHFPTLEIAALVRKALGDVSVGQESVYVLNKKTWQLEGLARPADGLNASGPEERHMLGDECL